MLVEAGGLGGSQPLRAQDVLNDAYAEIEGAIRDPDSIDADGLQRLETTLPADCLQHAHNKKLLRMIGHAHMPLTVNHAFHNAFNLHPDVATLTEHRAVLRHLLDGDVDAATEALAP